MSSLYKDVDMLISKNIMGSCIGCEEEVNKDVVKYCDDFVLCTDIDKMHSIEKAILKNSQIRGVLGWLTQR